MNLTDRYVNGPQIKVIEYLKDNAGIDAAADFMNRILESMTNALGIPREYLEPLERAVEKPKKRPILMMDPGVFTRPIPRFDGIREDLRSSHVRDNRLSGIVIHHTSDLRGN
jgi:hypothetical protein